jgi:hypothetical protein
LASGTRLFSELSQLDLLRQLQGIVDFDAKVPNGTFQFAVAEQELACAQISGLLVNQRHLCPAQTMRPVSAWLQIDHRNPLSNEAGVLAGADVIALATATREKPVIISAPSVREPSVDGFAGGIGYLERRRPTGLLLNHGRALAKRTAGRHVTHPQFDVVATAELGVDATVKKALDPVHVLPSSAVGE